MDRTNHLRRTLEAGESAYGAQAATFSPAVVEVYGSLGLDWVWVDLEHAGPSPWDGQWLSDLTRAADVADIELLVRLPGGDPKLIRKALDAGVRTLLIPRVESAAEVREAVAATRFRYDGGPGDRGVARGRVTEWGRDTDGYVEEEDANVTLGVMIENAAAVESLDDILAVPDLGFVFVGPADLSVSLGRPLEKGHPDVRGHVDRIERAALDAGVPLAGIASSAEAVRDAEDRGYQLLRIGGDISSAQSVLGERLDAVR
ncbi:HpcH/HpaI aldolase family protein [Salinirarus marinus]|uniref:HpcH/HpaI aldolase family protein n=1 Tax=Salinirarus marinus TaxID=3068310 RepID=UPI003C6CB4D1